MGWRGASVTELTFLLKTRFRHTRIGESPLYSHLELQEQLATLPRKSMGDSLRSLTPQIVEATVVTQQHTSAVQVAAKAMLGETAAGIDSLTSGLAKLVGGRKAQAGVEAVWETACGIAMLAESTWPPNPAAIVSAGLHFESAAQYVILGGWGAGSHRSAGGYGAGVAERPCEHEYNAGALQTLAPGAASRFSGTARVVVFGTDQELQNWVASAVNGAVQRGVNVTATASQRGAPVGH